MKTELKAKFLQHILGKKKDEQGFTLIELLVVIIIIGILSAIALPSFLNQAKKAKQSESKTYVGSMNKGQQAYYTENDEFATSVNDTGIGIKSTTSNYNYFTTAATGTGTNTYATSYSTAIATGLKNYGGRVYLQAVGTNSELTSIAFLCEGVNVATSGQSLIDASAGASSCNASGKFIK